MARTDLENVRRFIIVYASGGGTLRSMDRILEDKLRFFGFRLGFRRAGNLGQPERT